MKYFIFLALVNSFLSWGQEVSLDKDKKNNTTFPGSLFEYSQSIRKKLAEIKDLEPNEYVRRINKYRGVLEKYIDHKKRVCDGEFSTIILEPDSMKSSDEKTLSKAEKKLCLEELKAFQVTYINNMFVARKRYVDHVHTETVKTLLSVRDKSIKSLHSNFRRGRR